LHLHATWFFLLFLFLHPLLHWLYGGNSQLLRIFQPQLRLPQRVPTLVDALIERVQALEVEKASLAAGNTLPVIRKANPSQTTTVSAPLAIAVAAGAGALMLTTPIEEGSRHTLKIIRTRAATAPLIDGDISEAVWRRAPAVTVVTQHGANFDGG